MKDFWESLIGQEGINYFENSNLNKQNFIDLMGTGELALDFGAGVGRNINSILKKFNNVIAYDLPNIVNLLNNFDEIYDKSKTIYTSDWSEIVNKKFDCIYADSVLHHVEKNELLMYLNDMSKMTNKLIVNGRRFMDDENKDILPILNKYFQVNVLQVGADPNGFEMFVARLDVLK